MEGKPLKDYISDRVIELAEYIIENKATVRQTAKNFGVSKSTVHKDLSQRLPQYNMVLFQQVRKILDEKGWYAEPVSAADNFTIAIK
jgi:putative DeoR family transcriptional regulator (stage III sporulation protein D)